jgi:hypothetical protein
VRALRIVGRGLKDTYEHLFGYVLASVGWWISAVLIVTLPAGTLALCMVTDPRRAIDRPDVREVLTYLRSSLGKGWILALVTMPIPLVLFLNLYSFAGTENWLAVLAPLWAVLLTVGLIVMFLSFSTMALLSGGLSMSLKRAGYVAAAAPIRTLLVFVLLVIIAVFCYVSIVPAILLAPAIIGSIVNRLVLDVFEIPVIDPSKPTDERVHERTVSGPEPRRRWWGGHQ